MFEELEAAIDSLEIPLDGAALVRARHLLDRLESAVSTAVGEFDHAQMWELEGATSMTAWLRHHGAMSGGEAARAVALARLLRELPALADAWSSGTFAGGQVRAVAANVADRHLSLLGEHLESLLPALSPLSAHEVGVAVRAWADRADAQGADEPPPTERQRSLHLSRSLDDRHVLDGSFDAESGALVATALRIAETKDVAGEPLRSAAERRADALVDICRYFVDHQQERRGGRHRPHLNIVVDLNRVGGLVIDGPFLDGATVKRLLCDAGVHRVVTDGRSSILDYGVTTRTIPSNLWAALVTRDRHCRFEGCDRPPRWCEGHHVVHWEDGGPTNLENLVLLCSRHHHRCHSPGWSAKLNAFGEFVVAAPDGRTLSTHPPP